MIETKDDFSGRLKMGIAAMAVLSVGTLSVAFTLICMEFIESKHYLAGFAISLGATSTILSISAVAMRESFFQSCKNPEEAALIDDVVDIQNTPKL